MEFRNEKPKCVFAVPEKITVRQQLAYYSAAGTVDKNMILENSWSAAKQIIVPQSWKCEVMPDINASLEELTSPLATEVILWAGAKVREYLSDFENLPKN